MKRARLNRLVFALMVILLAISQAAILAPPANAATLSNDQLNVYNQGILRFDTEIGTSSCVTAATLTGTKVTEQVYNYLIGKGLSPKQAAGVMGNLQAESGINPRRVQNTPTPSGDRDNMNVDGKTGYGMAQWTSLGRQQNLHKAAVKASAIDGDLAVQLDFLWSELSGSYKESTLTPLLASSTVREATSIYMIHFESPKDQSLGAQDARAAFSLGWLTKYGSTTTATDEANTPADPTADDCSAAATTSDQTAVGNFVLPVALKWYKSNPEWFSKDHHDYPAADIPVPDGTPIYAATGGKIIKAPIYKGPANLLYTATGSYGLGVEIKAPDGVIYFYGHGIDGGTIPNAHEGDTVKTGQLIMHSNHTGNVTGPHLHFEIQVNGIRVCPQNLLVGIAKGSPPAVTSLPSSGCTN